MHTAGNENAFCTILLVYKWYFDSLNLETQNGGGIMLGSKKAGGEWGTLWLVSLLSLAKGREWPWHKPRDLPPEGPRVCRGPARKHVWGCGPTPQLPSLPSFSCLMTLHHLVQRGRGAESSERRLENTLSGGAGHVCVTKTVCLLGTLSYRMCPCSGLVDLRCFFQPKWLYDSP